MYIWNPEITENCICCTILEKETINHLFLKGGIAGRMWNYFYRAAGLVEHRINVKQSLRMWRIQGGNQRLGFVFNVIPIIISWFLYKRINTVLNGGSYHERKIVWEVERTTAKFVKGSKWRL